MLRDPLVGTICGPNEVWRMTTEIPVAQSEAMFVELAPPDIGSGSLAPAIAAD